MNTNTQTVITRRLIEDIKRGRAPKVLIVEDEQLDAQVLIHLLKSLNCECFLAVDGGKAMEFLKWDEQGEIALIFLDLRFASGPSGIEVLKWLKVNRPTTPVIVVSGYVDFDSTLRKVGGYVAAIQKPFTSEDIREILQKHKLF